VAGIKVTLQPLKAKGHEENSEIFITVYRRFFHRVKRVYRLAAEVPGAVGELCGYCAFEINSHPIFLTRYACRTGLARTFTVRVWLVSCTRGTY
jgi:hypothetical protein